MGGNLVFFFELIKDEEPAQLASSLSIDQNKLINGFLMRGEHTARQIFNRLKMVIRYPTVMNYASFI